MRPFPHSSQGVHTYRNHAEIYRTPSRHVREINCGTKVGRRKPREGPTTGLAAFGRGIGVSLILPVHASNKTNCSATETGLRAQVVC